MRAVPATQKCLKCLKCLKFRNSVNQIGKTRHCANESFLVFLDRKSGDKGLTPKRICSEGVKI
jgi:orotidine-5'-phosphate decarboxylase